MFFFSQSRATFPLIVSQICFPESPPLAPEWQGGLAHMASKSVAQMRPVFEISTDLADFWPNVQILGGRLGPACSIWSLLAMTAGMALRKNAKGGAGSSGRRLGPIVWSCQFWHVDFGALMGHLRPYCCRQLILAMR